MGKRRNNDALPVVHMALAPEHRAHLLFVRRRRRKQIISAMPRLAEYIHWFNLSYQRDIARSRSSAEVMPDHARLNGKNGQSKPRNTNRQIVPMKDYLRQLAPK